MPPLSIPKWGPVGVSVSLVVESRPLPLRHLAPECLKPRVTDIWGTHEPPEPSLQARESLLSTGENQRAQKTSRLPWASPAACSWHEPRHPPLTVPARQLGRLPGPRFTPGMAADSPHWAGLHACVLLSLPSPRLGCFALGCKFIFRSQPPPSPISHFYSWKANWDVLGLCSEVRQKFAHVLRPPEIWS